VGAALDAASRWLSALAAASAQVSAGDADDTQVAGLRLHALTCVSLAVGCVCLLDAHVHTLPRRRLLTHPLWFRALLHPQRHRRLPVYLPHRLLARRRCPNHHATDCHRISMPT
jgi:hypothetical protein